MATPNLSIDYLIANTSQPEVVVNEFLDDIDNLHGMVTHTMLSDLDYNLSTAGTHPEWTYGVIKIVDTSVLLTTARNIICPNNQKIYHLWNGTAQGLTIKTSAGTGISVAAGMKAIVFCDGTNVVRFSPDA